MTECDKIIIAIDNVLTIKTNTIATKKTNTIVTNVTNTASINFHCKKSKRLLYFVYSFINDHITIDNYYHLLLLCKKSYNIKWKIMNLKKLVFKIVCVIISMT